MRTVTALGVMITAAMVAASGWAEPATPANPCIGTWKLNVSLSKRPERGPGHGHFGGGFGGERGMGRRGAERPEGEPMGPGGGPGGGSPFADAESMRITVDGDELRLIGSDGHVRVLTLDGQPVTRHREYVDVTEKAERIPTGVRVTTTMPNGRTVTETFEVATDGSHRLTHTVTMPGRDGGEPRVITWVYDPEPTAAAPEGKSN